MSSFPVVTISAAHVNADGKMGNMGGINEISNTIFVFLLFGIQESFA